MVWSLRRPALVSGLRRLATARLAPTESTAAMPKATHRAAREQSLADRAETLSWVMSP